MAVSIPNVSTLDELHAIPEDGNVYELIRGALFMSAAPLPAHQRVVARLTAILVPYVLRERLGLVDHAPSVVRVVHEAKPSEVAPDLMVRESIGDVDEDRWEDEPLPILVVEVLSRSTRAKDFGPKRTLYTDLGIDEYWIVDRKKRSIHVMTPNGAERVVTDDLVWSPAGAKQPLRFAVADVFA